MTQARTARARVRTGMAFEDHAEVISVEGDRRMRAVSPDRALRAYRVGAQVTPQLMWL
ncbi:hypothetical protein [Streptomyces paludis]|uniref:hypothetical protein n=1 Tax=Streptomyces paludis TaxID=2282738 RepID=UPI0013B3D447|nr:hypothetical protein [Streptomyces paludis]